MLNRTVPTGFAPLYEQMLAAGAIIVAPERRSTEYFKACIPKEIEKNAAPIRAAGLSME